MKIVADPGDEARVGLSSPSISAGDLVRRTRFFDFVALAKPRVMALAVFTALVGMACAPVKLDAAAAIVAVVAIAIGAGASGVLNMWLDADIDAIMRRTSRRPIPSGRVSMAEAFLFGAALAVIGVAGLAFSTNLLAGALLAFTILFYVLVYTAWLKRFTPQNIVIGGAGGALPPIVGWVAATGHVSFEAFAMFLVIFLWTPPHFWALALNRVGDYKRAGIPMLPVVSGAASTKRQILLYSTFLLPASLTPCLVGLGGWMYASVASICGLVFVALALHLRLSDSADRRPASRLFAYSLFYLFIVFGALLLTATGGRGPAQASIETTQSNVAASPASVGVWSTATTANG